MQYQPQPLYQPVSFVSPIGDTTRRHSDHTTPLRRLSTYLKNTVTLEDPPSAGRCESIISDRNDAKQDTSRLSSTYSAQSDAQREWRTATEEEFWKRYGKAGEDGERRKSMIEIKKGTRKSTAGATVEIEERRDSMSSEVGLLGGEKGSQRKRKVTWGKGAEYLGLL
ncbi:hypothetical protein EK21DRAFT_109297 [Setomelanomma holmii]|uniref:Uncharacterized protein n=1 Tax=Setomelanomma holmii TaxID=210430 RepID=A0A9P4HEQ4_9PLEO|nr:hypothetical protein EK21DRAFT_109297 [Setomelanomma holmii]